MGLRVMCALRGNRADRHERTGARSDGEIAVEAGLSRSQRRTDAAGFFAAKGRVTGPAGRTSSMPVQLGQPSHY